MENSQIALQAALDGAVVEHAKFRQALAEFNRTIAFSQGGVKGKGFLLMGESSNGKTVIAKTMCAAYPRQQEDERVRIPVIMISMPANPTIRSFCMRLLDSFGHHYGERDSEAKLTWAVVTLIRNCGTLMLVIDEAQHLVDGNKINKTPAEVADWIKQLMNDSQICVTLIGTPRVRVLLDANSQLRSRFSRMVVLDGFKVTTEKETERLGTAVSELMKKSGYSGDSGFIMQPSVLQMLYYATDGRLGYIVKLLGEAIWTSQNDGKKNALTRQHFEAAFRTVVWFDALPSDNPFCPKFQLRRLVNEGEPFYTGAVQ